jgi:carnitine O-acetyltransferase
LIVNSNWWLLFQEDPQNAAPPVANGATNKTNIPLDPNPKQIYPAGAQGGGDQWLQSHNDKKDLYYQTTFDENVKTEWLSDWQIRRASWIIQRFAATRTKVQR